MYVCFCIGVNSFVLCLSDDSSDADLRLYEALKHCRQIGALAVINADTHPSFSALVSIILLLTIYLVSLPSLI